MIKIYFIVVNFNNFKYTKALICSLINQNGWNNLFQFQCIVINNSTDSHDTKLINEYCQNLSYADVINLPENPGYFGGLNYGLELIKENSNKIVIIGNNDLEFECDFCRKLVESQDLYPDNIHAICPDVITPEGRHQNPLLLNKISSFKRFQFDVFFSNYYIAMVLVYIKSLFIKIKNIIQFSTDEAAIAPGEIHLGIGACYVLTNAFFEHSHQLDFPTFMYGEEAFFSEQIHSNNGILYFDPSLIVYHAESATVSLLPKRTTYEYQRTGYPLYRSFL